MSALEASAQAPTPKYRRVDLGRGMWRLEPVINASVVPNLPASREQTDAAVAGQMLAEARQWARDGQFARARQLIEWASTLDVDWETQAFTPTGVLTELQVLELQFQLPQLPTEIEGLPNDSLLGPERHRLESGVDVEHAAAATDSSSRRVTTDPASPSGAAAVDETLQTEAIEAEATTHGQVGVPPRLAFDGEFLSANSAGQTARDNSVIRSDTLGFWRALAICALCGLTVMVLFALLLLRRVVFQQRDILQAMVETNAQRRDAAVQTDATASAAGPVQVSVDLPGQTVGWTEPDTFAHQKKRADNCRHEQETALVRELIARNVSIRNQVSHKRTAAA